MHPQARNEGLLTTTLPGGEVVVYNVEHGRYDHLSSTVGSVWQHCDGATSVERLADFVAVTYGLENAPEIVQLALAELRANDMLTEAPAVGVPADAITRRVALQRLGSRGVAAAMLPVITTFAVPQGIAALAVSAPPPPPPPGGQGCTPGYWKTHNGIGSGSQQNAWIATGYTTGTLLASVFAPVPSSLAGNTLYDALGFGGGAGVVGGAKVLLRAAVASLLNASHPDVSFDLSQAAVIVQVNAALLTGDRDAMIAVGDALDILNNKGCPI